jgi:hypothetical protein
MPDTPTPARAYYLSPPDFHRLDWACRPIVTAFDHTPIYLVGSALTRADYRDIDLRLILDDEQAAQYPPPLRLVLNVALSDLIAKAGLPAPVDFQIQSQTEADAETGARNPLGIPGIGDRL